MQISKANFLYSSLLSGILFYNSQLLHSELRETLPEYKFRNCKNMEQLLNSANLFLFFQELLLSPVCCPISKISWFVHFLSLLVFYHGYISSIFVTPSWLEAAVFLALQRVAATRGSLSYIYMQAIHYINVSFCDKIAKCLISNQ